MKQKKISLAVQAGHLKKWFPHSTCSIKRSSLTWIGTLKPTPLSQDYLVRVNYKLDRSPRVDLVKPKLERRNGKLPDHLYPGERLCLFLPKLDEWNGQMLLVETIVPWASEWLLHYEIWLATGTWCGGGKHPGEERKVEKEPRPKHDQKATRNLPKPK